VRVIWPCPEVDSGLSWNDNSLVVRLDFRGRSVLLTGDVERDAEAELVARRETLDVEVLKVPHHGSRTSSTAQFLRAVSPAIAVVSAGRINRFGHPHADVVARLAASRARVLRTDHDGGVIVETDGGPWRVVRAVD
jgi:competence protein ComEC